MEGLYTAMALTLRANYKRPARKRGDCFKCSGTGFLRQYVHIAQGECFACGGTGNSGRLYLGC